MAHAAMGALTHVTQHCHDSVYDIKNIRKNFLSSKSHGTARKWKKKNCKTHYRSARKQFFAIFCNIL